MQEEETPQKTYLAFGVPLLGGPKGNGLYPPIVLTKEILREYGLERLARAVENGAEITITYSDD